MQVFQVVGVLVGCMRVWGVGVWGSEDSVRSNQQVAVPSASSMVMRD